MHRYRVAAMLAIAAVAGALVTGGCVSAATKPPAAVAASARAAAATGGTANIMIYAVNTDGAYWHAIISGVIGDYGAAVRIYPDGQVDPARNSELDLRLHEPVYPKTCTDLVSVTGTTPIVAGSGTGAYRGVRGSFAVTLKLNEVEARPCQPSPGALRAQLITVAGSGTMSF